ncbi:hypothetical protein M2105_003332 [Paenibacillus sp. PastF-1]|nr:hypothetical protein [Paenibacillus sp. PastF-2]MDF9848900.1 hypothetical protein [Paenibacillus sp. PastM-2]MDF9855470.1 hypothetical protein [Paenibacillus sp. PastF-1]MDH6480654.1 hypothetical protein [Paenibacillus sp. PastH-2]MDH6508164.1 hypothetical protein [Paenibacillus sp. PastM-3]
MSYINTFIRVAADCPAHMDLPSMRWSRRNTTAILPGKTAG